MPQSIDGEVSLSLTSTLNGVALNGHSGHSERGLKRLDSMDYAGDVDFVPAWKGSSLDKREFVRLALQALGEMGYT
jgi:hypothetical protein